MKKITLSFFALTLVYSTNAQDKKNVVVPNENLITENISAIPKELAQKLKKYA